MSGHADRLLIEYVQLAIRSGATIIQIPSHLIENTSNDAREAVQQLCAVNQVRVEIVVTM